MKLNLKFDLRFHVFHDIRSAMSQFGFQTTQLINSNPRYCTYNDKELSTFYTVMITSCDNLNSFEVLCNFFLVSFKDVFTSCNKDSFVFENCKNSNTPEKC